MIRVVDKKTVILMGRDDESSATFDYHAPSLKLDPFAARGTYYATIDFLRDVVGVRWYMPTELGEVVPSRGHIAVSTKANKRRAPWARHRNFSPIWVRDLFVGSGRHLPGRETTLFWARHKIGGDAFALTHSLYSYADRFGTSHPEWWAPEEPKAEDQLCYSDPSLVAQVIQDARDYFDGKFPDGTYPGTPYPVVAAGDYFAVVPQDKNSRRQDWGRCVEGHWRDEWPYPYDFFTGKVSDYVWTFVSEVARALEVSHPDKKIAAAAYASYFYPPAADIVIPDNIAVMVTKEMMHYWDSDVIEYDRAVLAEYKSRVSELYVWEYYNFPQNVHHDKWPGHIPHRIASELTFCVSSESWACFSSSTATVAGPTRSWTRSTSM